MNAGPAAASLVSVVTIFLNAARFLDEAIASVVAQTHPAWELLLVDDGSSDGSAATARRWAAAHPDRIRTLAHPNGENRGMSASRNLGIAHARGSFVALLDADDLYLPEKLERQVEVLRRNPTAAMVFGPSLHWHSWTGRADDAGHDARRRLGVAAETLVDPPLLARRYLERRADTPATCSILVRREAVDAVGGFVSTFRDLYEDQAFFYKIALRFPIYAEGTAWDRYRRHPDALCEVRIREGTHRDDYHPTEARGVFLAWLERYLGESGADGDLLRLVARERWPYRYPRLAALGRRVLGAARSRPLAPIRRVLRPLVRRVLPGLARDPR